MALPEFVKKQVESKLGPYCEKKVPPHVRDKVRVVYKIRGNMVTLFEERPKWNAPDDPNWISSKIAQFRFDQQTNRWSLYCADRNGRWHFYEPAKPVAGIDKLIAEVDRDPTGIFWG